MPKTLSNPENDAVGQKYWDVIIIGGGITGAGIFHKLAARDYQVLLVDQNDFAFGTSSRSSKMVHGGLRYIANGQFNVTYESVREREHLQEEYPDLIRPMQFLLPVYEHYKFGASLFRVGIGLYDLFGSKWKHGTYTGAQIDKNFKILNRAGLESVLYYYDAEVDDARLVYRVISEGIRQGGNAFNYKKCTGLLRDSSGKVNGVQLKDEITGKEEELHAKVVINATGPWTDDIRSQVIPEKVIRKLRGSHILFKRERVPVNQAFTLFHPDDGRALFVVPWQGMTMVGTTDLDHPAAFEREKPEPFMTAQEGEYLLRAADFLFPGQHVEEKDIVSSFAGLRPIVSMGEMAPSKASRTHRIFADENLFSIAGGKLTTFRIMAEDLIQKILPLLPEKNIEKQKKETVQKEDSPLIEDARQYHRFSGIYGSSLQEFLSELQPEELKTLANTSFTLSEIRWAVRHEMVRHLSDLMLRRTRLGLLVQNGGKQLLDTIKPIVIQEKNWSEEKWEQEVIDYLKVWINCYSIPSK